MDLANNYCAEHVLGLYWNWKTDSKGHCSYRCNWCLWGK